MSWLSNRNAQVTPFSAPNQVQPWQPNINPVLTNQSSGFLTNPDFSLSPAGIGTNWTDPGVGATLNTGDLLTNWGNQGQEGGFWNGVGNFMSSDGFKNSMGALQTGFNIYQGLGALRNARDQLRFTKNFANANLANQTQSYNTALEDRARSRGAMEGQSAAQTQAYIDQNRLKDRKV